jgi:hypothetical protein
MARYLKTHVKNKKITFPSSWRTFWAQGTGPVEVRMFLF